VTLITTTLSRDEVQRLPRLPSAYKTDRVYRLSREVADGGWTWSLFEERLATPFSKTYDDGDVDDWVDSYEDGQPGTFHFIGALDGERCVGLLTWREQFWNGTLWLIDIRTREDARRQGAGSALIQRLQEIARNSRVRGITVETQITNYAAISFYRKHGFECAGFHDHFYGNDDIEKQDVAIFLFWEVPSAHIGRRI
jgi:ribosomal protein S18 acetylase RimI-like enzyme